VRQIDLKIAVFVVRRPSSDPKIEPAVAEDVDHRRLLGQADRMMEGKHADAGTQPDGLGLGGDMRKDGHQRRKDAIAAGMVLRDPDCIEPECLGIADLLEGLVIDASLVGGVVLSP